MLSLLVERDEIAEAQEALERVMENEFEGRERRNITFRPRSLTDQEVWTRARYWYRPGIRRGPNVTSPRFLNWFGVLVPATLSITVEANIPLQGRNGRVAGFFARDDSTGALYLMHSGNIGGGKSGVSGRAFRAWYGERLIPVYDDRDRVRFGSIMVSVGASDPTRPARRYVDSIEAFRRAVEAGENRH